MADPLTYANSDEYVLVNPSDPKVGHLVYDAPMVDAETKQFIRDPETGKIKVYRMVIWGTKGLTQAQVESLISQNNVTLTTKINNLESTVTNFLDADDTTLDQLSELVTEIKNNKTNIASLVSDKATKTELAEVASKANAITVSDTAPNVASMPVASGIMHPSQNIITEDPDVSILALQQNLWAYNATRDYAVGSFVIYNNSIYQCLVANGPSSTVANPSNVVYWTQIPTLEDLKNKFVPTGTILLYAGSVLPDSYLGCQGAPFDPTVYTDLYAKIGTTYGGTAESPLLPDFRNRYPIGAGTNALGTYIAEQLPNILGEFSHKTDSYASYGIGIRHAAGAFAASSENPYIGNFQVTSFYTGPLIVYMNAHNSNSIYTDSGHVYPQSLALNFIIKT